MSVMFYVMFYVMSVMFHCVSSYIAVQGHGLMPSVVPISYRYDTTVKPITKHTLRNDLDIDVVRMHTIHPKWHATCNTLYIVLYY